MKTVKNIIELRKEFLELLTETQKGQLKVMGYFLLTPEEVKVEDIWRMTNQNIQVRRKLIELKQVSAKRLIA